MELGGKDESGYFIIFKKGEELLPLMLRTQELFQHLKRMIRNLEKLSERLGRGLVNKER